MFGGAVTRMAAHGRSEAQLVVETQRTAGGEGMVSMEMEKEGVGVGMSVQACNKRLCGSFPKCTAKGQQCPLSNDVLFAVFVAAAAVKSPLPYV